MRTRHVAAIVLRQYYLMRGSLSRFVPLFAWVAVDIVLWGFITRYLNSFQTAGLNFVPIFLGAVLLWDFFTRVMQGVTIAFFEDVWARNFLNIFASPLSLGEYLAGLVITTIATSSLGLMVMLILATSIFGLSFFTYGAMFLPFLFLLLFCGIALGIFCSAIVLRLGPASEWFVWPIPALITPFAGVFYPIATLPPWMRYVSMLLPPSYVFEGMRSIISHGTTDSTGLVRGGALTLLYLILACLFFRRVYRQAVKSGLIARYSAESVG
jgi:ABC-2 type transport system permease protein